MEDSQSYGFLASEVNRIISSPYPTQLKYLRDLLCTTCTERDISRWALSHPCQLKAMASCVVDGLRQWPYVLDIIARMSCNVDLRNAYLSCDPSLLHDCVIRAVQAQDVNSKYAAASVAMLSHQLPDENALPAECQALIVQLFEFAAHRPSVSTIRPIYRVLKGTSTMLLGILSNNVLLRFEEHLFNIVRNLRGDDQSLSLYCLAIMKMMATASDVQLEESAISSYDTQELLASTQLTSGTKWKPDSVKQYFTDRKAQKTIQLVVLRVMWACTTTTGDCRDEKMESLRLANDIIAAVPEAEREVWRKANALVPKKFEEKVLSPSLDPALRFQALSFLARLSGNDAVPAAVIGGLRRFVINTDEIAVLDEDDHALEESLVCSAVFDANTTTALVQNIVDFTAGSNSRESIERCTRLTVVLQRLHREMSHQDAIVEGTMLALDVLSCGDKLRRLQALVESPHTAVSGENHAAACFQALQASRGRLIHELCRIFLKASLSSSSSTFSIPSDTLALLVDLHAASAQSVKCSHEQRVRSTKRRTIPFVEASNTPDESVTDWRQILQAELHSRASSELQRLETVFSKACAELEDRCDNAERPLREEQEKLRALQQKFDDLDKACCALETDGIDRNVRLDALELERDQCLSDLDTAQEETSRLELNIRDLEQRLRLVKNEADENLSEERQALERAELEHAAVLASKEEEIDELRSAVTSLEEKMLSRDQELGKIRTQLEDAASREMAANRSAEELKNEGEERKIALDVAANENATAMRAVERLEAQVVELEEKIANVEVAHQFDTRRLEENAKQDLQLVRKEHEHEMLDTSSKHDQLVRGLEARLSAEEEASRHAAERHSAELEQHDAEITEMQKKLDRLNSKCEQKDRQIEKYKAKLDNIYAAMGFTGQEHPTGFAQRPSRSSTAATRYVPPDDDEDPSPPTPFSGDDLGSSQQQLGVSFASNESSTESRGGPTPKRPRPRKAFKVPSPAAPHPRASSGVRVTRTSLKGHSAVKRLPLGSISGNQSVADGKASKAHYPAKMDNLDDTTFDGSEIFTGTAGDRL